MRKLILIFLLLPVFVKAQGNYSVSEPRLRVYRSASLNLSTTWQTIVFGASDTYNINTYGINPATGNNMIWYDTGTNLFKVEGQYDRNLTFQLFPATTTNLITTQATLQMRIVIPNGVSPGVDLYVPYTSSGGYVDLASVTILTSTVYHPLVSISLPAGNAIRTNGFYVQLRLSNALITLGTCVLNNCAATIQSKY
jgi:hypothetical protein